MKYGNIKNPKELLRFMEDNIEYGFCDESGNKYREYDINFSKECPIKWRLSSPEKLLITKIGHCFDHVELERDWFLKNNYEFKTIFIMFFNTNLPTHTYLVYKENDKWYWFENADFNNKGIHEFNNLDDAILFQMNKHIEYVNTIVTVTDKLLSDLHIFEYDKPLYGSNSIEFINFIVDYGKDITNIICKKNVKKF